MTKIQPLASPRAKGVAALLMALIGVGAATQVLAAQFKLGVEEKDFINNAPPLNNNYAAPQMVSPMQGGAASYDNSQPRNPMQGNASQQRPLQGNASVALPPQFLGSWLVQGQRSSVDAQPQYQAGIGNLFQGTTRNTWNISGSPQQGYTMSNDMGVSTSLNIYKVSKNTAFIRYQHPISKTMAQEAIVMELQNGGASFQGLERISIVKEGEQQPRAKITYQLVGQRQR